MNERTKEQTIDLLMNELLIYEWTNEWTIVLTNKWMIDVLKEQANDVFVDWFENIYNIMLDQIISGLREAGISLSLRMDSRQSWVGLWPSGMND